MKIGILTLPFNNNYGGYLQAYALQTVFEREGHEVEIIDRRHPKETNWKLFKRFVKTTLHGERFYKNLNERKGTLMRTFVKSRMHLSKPIYSSEGLRNYCVSNQKDLYIAGSDQLWRPEYVPNVEDYFFGYLPDSVERVAYAASFGVSSPLYTDAQIESCGDAIQMFSAVGLRENSGEDIIRSFGWKANNVKIVLDPTMLLEKEHYESLLNDYIPSKCYNGAIMTYILDNDKSTKEIVNSSMKILGLPCVEVIDSNRWKKPNYILPSIEEWLCAFRDADYVITDSFHGTVFSILFHKPFVVKINRGRGQDRFDTLLGYFGLRDRLVIDGNIIANVWQNKIDWEKVELDLSILSRNSNDFLCENFLL